MALSLDIFCRGFLRELSHDYEIVAIAADEELLSKVGQREKVRVIPADMRRGISPWADLRTLINLVRIFKRERPTIVHSITPKAGLLTMVAGRIARVPVRLHTFTGLLFPTASGLRRTIFEWSDKLTCRCATHILAEGKGVRHDLHHHITRTPITVLGNGNLRGIDTEHYRMTDRLREQGAQMRRKMGIDADAMVFLYVGRINRDKGLHELSVAFRSIAELYSCAYLVVVGWGDDDAEHLSIYAQDVYTLHSRVSLLAWQDDVRPYYATADCLVLPSYREGFPNSVIEAGAMGLPAIVTDVNGSREIITDGVNGYIVAPADAAALANKMKYAITHRDELAAMGENARRTVVDRYEISFVRSCQKRYYADLVAKYVAQT